MAGYSSTPLAKKLGYKPTLTVHLHHAPANYLRLLALGAGEEPAWCDEAMRGIKLVHAFTTSLAELKKLLVRYRKRIASDGAIWISWPKKAAKGATDITEDRIRDVALPLGLIDIKVCAVDETWSGLKLVIRKELR